MNFHPDGSQTTDYRIEVGEYPVTVGVPVMIKSAAKVSAIANELTGWPKLLPAGANIDVSGDVKAKGKVGEPIKLKTKHVLSSQDPTPKSRWNSEERKYLLKQSSR
jgi:hypothetical protein